MSASLPAATVARTGLRVTRVAFGGAPLGGLFSAVSEDAAFAALSAAWDAGIRYFDTAPLYGYGLSEQRLGRFLQTKPRDAYVISTKVGRLLRPARANTDTGGSLAPFIDALPNEVVFDYSGDAVRRSIDASLTRLGLDRVDIAYIHDPDEFFETALDEAYPALHALREERVVAAIGAGMNQWEMLARFVERCDFDAILVAGRYTLLDRSAEHTLLPLCERRGVAVIAAGVFNSGLLAHAEPPANVTFNYVAAPPAVIAQARAMAAICARHGTTLPAAAMAFPLRHPSVAAILLGMRSAEEVHANRAAFGEPLPPQLWDELEAVRRTTS